MSKKHNAKDVLKRPIFSHKGSEESKLEYNMEICAKRNIHVSTILWKMRNLVLRSLYGMIDHNRF